MEEKETQCQSFRELLLEKENDIAQLSEMLEKANIDNQPQVDARTKLSNVLEAMGQNISAEESFDSLLEKVINITDGSGNQEENFIGVDADDEKKKLLELTQKLKSECLTLREKLKGIEEDHQQQEQLEQREESVRMAEQLVAAQQALKKIEDEREDWRLTEVNNETVRAQQAQLNNELEAALTAKTEEIHHLKEKSDYFQQESEDRAADLGSLSEQNSVLQTELNQSKERQVELQSKVSKLEEEILSMSTQLDVKSSESSQMSCQVEQLADSLSEAEQQNQKLKEETVRSGEDLARQEKEGRLVVSNLQSELSRLEDQICQLQREKEISEEKVGLVSHDLSESNEKFSDLQGKLAQTVEELNKSLERTEAGESRMSSVLAELANKDQELIKYQGKVEEFMQTNCLNETIMKERNGFQDEIELLKNQNEKLVQTLSDLKTRLEASEESCLQSISCSESLDSEIKDIRTQLLASDNKNKTLLEELETTKKTCDHMKTQLEASESSKLDLTAKHEKMSAEYENLQEEMRQLENRFENTQVSAKQVTETELQITEIQAENSKLLKDLESVKSVYDADIKELKAKLNTATSELNIFSELQENHEELKSNNNLLGEEMLQMKENHNQLQMEITNLKSENEDLMVKNQKLEEEGRKLLNQKEVVDSTLVSASSKVQELLQENEKLESSRKSSSESCLALQKELESLEISRKELKDNLEEIKNREQNYVEALNSLKSINEAISRTARETEGEKIKLKQNEAHLVLELEQMKEQERVILTKNIELSSQVEILTSIKKGLEQELIDSNKRNASLEDDVKNLSTKKENQNREEKDVDESEESVVDKNIIQVMNEKIRENAKLKSENSNLLKNINQEIEAKLKLETEIEESKKTFSSMNSEALKKLSLMIRDKDLEIESLSQRNKSLLEILENEKSPKPEKDSEREALLLEEIKKLKEEKVKDKQAVDNSNELLFLKGRIRELENRLSVSPPAGQTPELNGEHNGGGDGTEGEHCDRSLALRLETKSVQLLSSEKQTELLNTEINEMKVLLSSREEELRQVSEERNNCKKRGEELEQEVERVRKSLLSVQGLLDEKKNSNESQQEQSLKYIAECERLSKELTQTTNEKAAAVQESKARSQEAQDLRREVSAIIEKKKRVEGEVERLRTHLVQVEEGYTVELMEAEEREKELRKKVAGLEDKVRVATHTSSEVSESASQVSHQLTAALETAAGQRDKLSDQLAASQASLRSRNMELRNLQFALEGFQKQKENEVGMMEKMCEEKVAREQRAVAEVQEKLRLNKQQLDRAQQGLEAAARLSEQLDKKSSTISNLKQEMSVREEMVKSLQEKMLDMTNGQVGKVDRDLVKNLVIGYSIADVSKKPEILRIIATVLDFNGEERTKTGLEGSAGGWLGGFLAPSRSRHGSTVSMDQNIARAFIKFLEEESSPKDPISLPVVEMARTKAEELSQASSRSGKTPSPLLSVETPPRMSLASLASSHSPSILKSVLDSQSDGNNSNK